MSQSRIDPWVVAAIVAGVALRLINLGTAPLWFDETYTFQHLVTPWQGWLTAVVLDNQAPLYYATTKAWAELAGLSPFAMRIPGVLASVACIPLVAAVARLLAGDQAARTAAWVTAISPYLVQHAQDARPYALLSAFALTSLLLLVRFALGRSPRLGFWWAALALAIVTTHFYGIFFLTGQGLALLLLWRRPLASWLPTSLAAGAVCGALVLMAAKNASGGFAGQYIFGVAAMPGVVWSMLAGYTLLPTSEQLHALGPRAILPHLPIALAALPAFVVVVLAGLRTLNATGRIVLLSTFCVALSVPFLYRLTAGAGVHPRYFSAAIGPLLIVTAIGMTTDRSHTARTISAVVLALVMSWATFLHLRDTDHGREDVASAGQWLDANVPPDDEILVTSSEMEVLARFHWPHRRFRLYPAEKEIVKADRLPSLVEGFPFSGSTRAIFVVGRAWVTDPEGELQAALAARYPGCPGIDVPGIRIHCFQPAAGGVADSRP